MYRPAPSTDTTLLPIRCFATTYLEERISALLAQTASSCDEYSTRTTMMCHFGTYLQSANEMLMMPSDRHIGASCRPPEQSSSQVCVVLDGNFLHSSAHHQFRLIAMDCVRGMIAASFVIDGGDGGKIAASYARGNISETDPQISPQALKGNPLSTLLLYS